MFRRKTIRYRPISKRRSLFSRGDRVKLERSVLKPTVTAEPRRARPVARPRPARPRRRNLLQTVSSALLACGIALFWPAAMGIVEHGRNEIWGIDRYVVRDTLARHLDREPLPSELLLPDDGGHLGRPRYTLDDGLQRAMEEELAKYRPDYGMVLAMDAETGEILVMADIRRDGVDDAELNLRATYPAASVFKTVTAAAAIDMGRVNAASVLPYNGKTTTLYKKNVLQHRNNKWTRHDTLEKSFSKSANTVFARLGIYTVGGERLQEYSDRFHFNRPIEADIPVQTSTIEMDPAEEWSVAETASGYTRGTNISPVHGAMLAAAIVNDGLMPAPRLVDTITDRHGIILYEPGEPALSPVIGAEAAAEMRKLMAETVASGSASQQFRGFARKHPGIEVGGKTGSLTGFTPKGRYDWFVGYASDGERKLAYAVLCINQEFWYVKSAHLARRLIENYFPS